MICNIADSDSDGIVDAINNCLVDSNSGQEDCDSNHTGDACCCGQYTNGFTSNTDCSDDGKRNLADITRLVDRVHITKAVLCREENGNVEGDSEAKVNLADITRLIDHVHISKTETAMCR